MRLLRGWQPADETTVLDALSQVDQPTRDVLFNIDGDPLAEARYEADQQRVRAEMAEQERNELRAALAEWKQAAGAEADLVDDLGVRSLPSLPGAVLTDSRPVGALIHNALADETGVDTYPNGSPSEPLHDIWTPPPPTDWDAWTGSVGE